LNQPLLSPLLVRLAGSVCAEGLAHGTDKLGRLGFDLCSRCPHFYYVRETQMVALAVHPVQKRCTGWILELTLDNL